ncbi:GNAT family N-acetyltransferase [Hyphomicrobium sp. MC8b]|jgi:ribosomal protein S18 acetylase RimI-like enzyme|uniref:GNAT family N-acetyltransferase n=1 Tax=unclassified Hyphomicrobium TaxID=2619925 RepID=UPI00391DF6D8
MTSESAELLGAPLAAINPWAHYRYTPEALTTFLRADEDDAPRLEILVDGTLAGGFSIRRTWLRGPYLQFLGILPPFQNSGVGNAVLSWFEAEGNRLQARNIWVSASDFNVRAIAFYERFGFVRIATLEGLVAEGTDEVLLRKRLIIG